MDVLIESQYLPPIASFAYFARAETIILEACENYQKGSYRNRCHLAGANGALRLSIPLRKGKHNQLPIQAVEISYDEPWHRQHWQAIRSAYGNAPFFPFYADALAAIYEQRPQNLWALNLDLLATLFKLLGWSKPIQYSEDFVRTTPDHVLDLRQQIRPGRSDTPIANLSFPSYPQVFTEKHGFLPNLSILDLLFCSGPQTGLYLNTVLAG